jgi:inosine-uridine nucleoside N-ribohydrolase
MKSPMLYVNKCLLIAFYLFISAQSFSQTPVEVKIIFDTDFGGDADDLGAIAMLQNFHNRGECELLAIMLWNTEQYTVPAIDAINRYYDNPEISIGVRSHETHTLDWQHARPIAEAFPHKLTNKDVPLALDLYRKILSAQPNQSVVIVITGPMANIRDLILSQPDEYSPLTGKELIEQKVKEFSIMGGKFPSGENEWNFNGDMPGVTKFVLENLTVPIVFSGYEIGVQIPTGPRLVEAGKESPLYVGYQYFSIHAPWMHQFYQEGKITPNATYDQTSVLYTVRGGLGVYWDMVENGICIADSTGGNIWKEVNDRPTNHAYLVLKKDPEEMARIIYSFMLGDF